MVARPVRLRPGARTLPPTPWKDHNHEHGHDTVTVYDDYLTYEGYILVEFWGHPSVPTPAPVMWSVRLEDDDEHELEFRGEPGASPDDAASMLELALATLY